MEPVEIILNGEGVEQRNKEWIKNSRKVAAYIVLAAREARRGKMMGTAEWLLNLAEEFKKLPKIEPMRELL